MSLLREYYLRVKEKWDLERCKRKLAALDGKLRLSTWVDNEDGKHIPLDIGMIFDGVRHLRDYLLDLQDVAFSVEALYFLVEASVEVQEEFSFKQAKGLSVEAYWKDVEEICEHFSSNGANP